MPIKNLKALILSFCVVLGIASCKQESVEADKASDELVVEAAVSTQNYVYKGSTYTISLRKGVDGYQLIDGKDNQKVQLLLEGPRTAQVVGMKEPNTIYVFDSYKESQAFMKSNSSAKSGRVNAEPARCYLYSETKYGGSYYNYANTGCPGLFVAPVCNIPDYTNFGGEFPTPVPFDFNDQVGSLYIHNPAVSSNVRVDFWEDINYVGRSISFWSQGRTEFGVYDLGTYRFGGLWGNKYSWNDRISSSVFYRF